MQVRIKLMAALRSRLPADAKGGAASVELDPGATVAHALDKLGIPHAQIHLVMINGTQEPSRDRALAAGDELVVFPPVAGG